jgi:hypothetical protein
MMQEDTAMSYEAAITVGNRKAGDSIDFHAGMVALSMPGRRARAWRRC